MVQPLIWFHRPLECSWVILSRLPEKLSWHSVPPQCSDQTVLCNLQANHKILLWTYVPFQRVLSKPMFLAKDSPSKQVYRSKPDEPAPSGTNSRRVCKSFHQLRWPFCRALDGFPPPERFRRLLSLWRTNFIVTFETSILFKTDLRLFSGRSFDIQSFVSKRS